MKTRICAILALIALPHSLPAQTKEIASFKNDEIGCVHCVVFSPDGKTLALGCGRVRNAPKDRGGDVILWDVEARKGRAALKGHTSYVSHVAFSNDGKTLASSGRGPSKKGQTKLWDVATGKERASLDAHEFGARSVAFSPDDKSLASCGAIDNKIKIWDVATGKETHTLAAAKGSLDCLAYSPDGKTLATGGSYFEVGEGIKFWDLATGKVRAGIKFRTAVNRADTVSRIAFSRDGKLLASVSTGAKSVQVWDPETGMERKTLKGHIEPVISVAFSPDGKMLASGAGNYGSKKPRACEVKLWDPETGKELANLKGFSQPVLSVAFSPNGELLATGSGTVIQPGRPGEMKLWKVR